MDKEKKIREKAGRGDGRRQWRFASRPLQVSSQFLWLDFKDVKHVLPVDIFRMYKCYEKYLLFGRIDRRSTIDASSISKKHILTIITTRDHHCIDHIESNTGKMPATIYLISGGARSGKSRYAEEVCESLSKRPIYLATAKVPKRDTDFLDRIQKHKETRQNTASGSQWSTIEEPLNPTEHLDEFKGQVVLVDCLTLWLTNWLMEEGAFTVDYSEGNVEGAEANKKEVSTAVERGRLKLQDEFDQMVKPYNITYVFVTNEVGSGTHGATHVTRKFVDAQGWLNQYIAKKANQVVHMVCGMPNILKSEFRTTRAIAKGDGDALASPEAKLESDRLDRHLSSRKVPMDKKGYFTIKTVPEEGLIVIKFISSIVNDKGEVCDLQGNKISCGGNNRPDPLKVWKCRTAKEATVQIFEEWPAVNQLELSVGHVAYVGREVQKAEYSLYQKGCGPYQQD